MKLASDCMKRYYDIDTQESKLEVGDPVWLYNPQQKKGLSPKLQKPWQGPYVIIKRINDLIYRIQLGPRLCISTDCGNTTERIPLAG